MTHCHLTYAHGFIGFITDHQNIQNQTVIKKKTKHFFKGIAYLVKKNATSEHPATTFLLPKINFFMRAATV